MAVQTGRGSRPLLCLVLSRDCILHVPRLGQEELLILYTVRTNWNLESQVPSLKGFVSGLRHTVLQIWPDL